MSKVIVLEGPDKVGKETQSKKVASTLQGRGVRAIRVEPAKESSPRMKKLIYSMLDSGAAKRYPHLFQFAQFLNRMYFQYVKLPKLVNENDVIILDRWALSGYAYGKAEGISETLNKWMYNRAQRPNLVVVLYGNSYKRSTTTDDSYENDNELQKKVTQTYFDAGLRWPGHKLVFNDVSIDEVHQRIIDLLEKERVIPSSRCPVCNAAYDEPCSQAYHR